MMTIPMDNNQEISSRERAQRLFNENVELENKRRKAAQARIPSDPNTWQLMRENYEAIILEDHAFSEQHDIEYALWQLHYRRIEELRALFNAALAPSGSAAPQNGKVPVQSGPDRLIKVRSQFKTFLSEATGFYHDLMVKIRSKYGMPLGYFSDDPDNQIPLSKDGTKSSEVKKGLISCHRCLIYLGDLARYKGLYGDGESKARDFAAASSYYMHSSSLWPSSGNPHHQLAILAGYSNDELVSIYRYFRSLAVDSPFTTARDNLIIAFEKNRQNYTQLIGDIKSTTAKTTPARMSGKGRGKGEPRPPKDNRLENNTVKEKASNSIEPFKAFITRFIRLNGILFTRTSLETFGEVFVMVKKDFLELLSFGTDEGFNFGSDAAECRLAILRIVAILIFTVHNVNRESENQSYADILQRSVLLQNASTATFEFIGCIVERCNQLKDPSLSYLLPGIMVFIEWLACRQDVAVGSELEEKQINARAFFWNNCISLLNKLISSGYGFVNQDEDETCFSNMSKYDESETANRLALAEDFELRGFLPLLPAQLILDFSRKHSLGADGDNKEKSARVQRIIAAGKSLISIIRIGQEGVYFDTKLKKNVIGVEPQVPDDYTSFDLYTNGDSLDISASSQRALSASPTPEVRIEAEDEEEVIVFKPSVNEKLVDELKLTTSEAGKVHFRNQHLSSVGHDSFVVPNSLTASERPATSGANVISQYLAPGQPSMSNWAVESTPITNGLAHLNLAENGLPLKSERQDLFDLPQPAAFSLPYPHFVGPGATHNFSSQITQVTAPSMLDSFMPSGAAADGLPGKTSSIMPPGVKKNPVSRPGRHVGPPPGFGSLPSKTLDETLNNTVLKNGNPLMPQTDDYSWLDGYNLSAVSQSMGFSNSINQDRPTFHISSKSNGSMGIAGFPFPGKQVSTQQVLAETQKAWQDYQFVDYTNLPEEQQQQQQMNKGNQLPVGPPQQYQGQSLWDGRFFV